jgi:hypothetical protein
MPPGKKKLEPRGEKLYLIYQFIDAGRGGQASSILNIQILA